MLHASRRRSCGGFGRRLGGSAGRSALAGVVLGLVAGSLGAPGQALTAASAPASRPAAAADGQVGSWRVVRRTEGVYRITWRSPHRLRVAADRPVVRLDGRVLGAGRVGRDGRTVSLDVVTSTPPDPARLDVVLSGDRIDVAGRDLRPGAPAAVTVPATTPLPVDPATPGPYDVVTSDYQLDPVPIAKMPEPIEMVGHVVEPAPDAATGPRPLVLFLHGRHSYCYDPATGDDGWKWPCTGRFDEIPSHLGYDYIQQVLASQGFATVSIRVNGINAQDWVLADGGAAARALIVERHLDHWVGLAAAHQVDLARVVLVGHSRGGEGVDRAALQIPLSAPYRIAGQVLLAPTNFGTQTAAYVPTVTVLPYCDGDVSDLQGQRFTDVARDLTFDDTSLRSSVMVMGANHNFFNTEWTPGVSAAPSWDDWWGASNRECGTGTPTRLTDAEQRSVGVAYVAGAVQLFTRDAQEFLPMYDGSPVHVASTGDADVRSAAIGGGRQLRRPGKATGLTLPVGATSQFCSGVVLPGGPATVCGRGKRLSTVQTPHWPDAGELVPTRRAFELAWTAAGQSGGMVFDTPLDLTARRLELRTIVDPQQGDAEVKVRLTDTSGASAVVDPVGGDLLPAMPAGPGLGKRWAQALVVDPTGASGVDLGQVARVDLVAQNDHGRVWVLDVAAAPASLPTVPDKRLPLVSLGTLRVPEGDGTKPVTAQVPFTITGELTTRGSLAVGVVSWFDIRRPERRSIDLSPGQTSGTIPVTYQPNVADDFARKIFGLFAWARLGVMTDRYDGRLVVLDDDPAPKVTVSPVRATISEGQQARWRVTLSAPYGHDQWYEVRVVRGPDGVEPVRVGDVPKSWLEQVSGQVPPARKPLWRMHLFLGLEVKAGELTGEVAIPIRADGVREGREALTVAVARSVHRSYVRTVYVRP